jgi:hypothetical protein
MWKNISGVAILASLASAAPAHAEEGDWEFSITPYLMAPAMDGQTAAGPLETNISTSPADIFRNLNWGAMATIEANNGRFGIAADITYMNLEAKRDGLINKVGGQQGAYTGMLLARIDPNAEVYIGARLNDLGVKLSGTGPLGNPREASRSRSWVDPLIGMRVNLPLGQTTDLTVMADIGGFGVSSDIAVQAWPTVGFRLSEGARALVGYRVIYTDYEAGSGLRRFKYDVVTHGPTVGVKLSF